MFRKHVVLLALITLVSAGSLSAQGIGARLKAKVSDRLNARLEAGLEKVADKFDGAVGCVLGDEACVAKAKKDKKKVVLLDEEGEVLPAEQQPKDSPAADPAKNPSPGSAAAKPAPAGPAWDNFDFRPGERILFADDFSADRVGNFPRRLELLKGNMEVVTWGGKPWLRLSSDGAFAIKLPETLPKRFTIEYELAIPHNNLVMFASDEMPRDMITIDQHTSSSLVLSCCDAGVYRGAGKGESVVDPRSLFDDFYPEEGKPLSRPFKVRVEVDGTYMKAYLDEKRVANIPNANFARAKALVFQFEGPQDGVGPYITGFSVNAGGKEMYDALLADGRVVTQGIFFDVNSDVIRPESTPTLKEIGEMLKAHPELKLTVEGHTDNTGNAAANQTLSEKRAKSIVTHLVSNYGISADRLAGKGLGASKPAAPNDSPEGRQSNRRVELVKM